MAGLSDGTSMSSSINTSFARKVKGVRVPYGNNPFKLVACDMDGTLLNRHHSVSDRTRRVISQLLARGVHVIFATGRPFTDVHRIKKRLNVFASAEHIATPGVQVMSPAAQSPVAHAERDSTLVAVDAELENVERVVPRCFAVTSNGTCIYDELNQRVYERTICPELCQELYNLFKNDPDININIFRGVDEVDRQRDGYVNLSDDGEDKAQEEWISRYPSDLEAALYHESHFVFRVVPDLERSFPTDHVNEIFFLCYDLDKCRYAEDVIVQRANALKEQLRLPHSVRVAPSAPTCLDIIPDNVSKGSALQFVVEQLGITMADCVAFGDGMNDLEMLQAVGRGYVMGNASDRVKAALPQCEVIGHHDDDGVARKLCELFDLED